VELTKKQIGVTVSSGDLMVYPLIWLWLLAAPGVSWPGLEDGYLWHASGLPWAIDFGAVSQASPPICTNIFAFDAFISH